MLSKLLLHTLPKLPPPPDHAETPGAAVGNGRWAVGEHYTSLAANLQRKKKPQAELYQNRSSNIIQPLASDAYD